MDDIQDENRRVVIYEGEQAYLIRPTNKFNFYLIEINGKQIEAHRDDLEYV